MHSWSIFLGGFFSTAQESSEEDEELLDGNEDKVLEDEYLVKEVKGLGEMIEHHWMFY